MAKKRKIIKRVYEKGNEEVFPEAKRRSFVEKQARILYPSTRSSWGLPIRMNKKRKAVRRAVAEQVSTTSAEPQNVFVDHQELPSLYGTTRLTLLAKDPYWIYAYWEITPNSLESFKKILPKEDVENAKFVLRIYDVTLINFDGKNANRYFDIEVGPQANNWYINLWADDVSYIGDLGIRIPDGRFFALTRSNCVHTPRMGYSSRTEQIWMKVTDEGGSPAYVRQAEAKPSSFTVPAKGKTPEIIKGRKKRRTFYLTEDDIKRYYSSLSPLLRDIISARLTKAFGKKARKPGMNFFLLEGETDEERGRIFSMLPKDYFIRRMLIGSSQELIMAGSEERIKGASEFVHEKIRQHKFFFELMAELIVYGRTEPNAQVLLGDKKVQLREDGTFSLRFALPDGKIPLEFTAASHDKKEQRKINTYVERNTKSL